MLFVIHKVVHHFPHCHTPHHQTLRKPKDFGCMCFFSCAGCRNLKEVTGGVQHIMADVIAKDKELGDTLKRL